MTSYPKIVVSPPGPKAIELLSDDKKYVSPCYKHYYPLIVKSANGCIIKDVDDNEYIDFNSGLSCMNVGHTHPKVVQAIKDQSDKLIHYSYSGFYTQEVISLAKKVTTIVPGTFEKKVYFGNSGTEAVEAAIKLARWHTRKQLFIGFIGAFHGRTLGSLSFAANKPREKEHFMPLVPGVIHVPYAYCYRCPFKLTFPTCDYWCVDYIDEYVLQKYTPPEDTAAILVEPIQGENGCIVPPPEYFTRLKKLADKYGLLIVDDEIQAGVGRTGKWFAIEHWGIEPEIICVAHALASGLALSATVSKVEVTDWGEGTHGSAIGGSAVACAAADAVIDIIKEEHLLDNANKQGAYAVKRLEELKQKSNIIGDVRGKGLMMGVELVRDKESKDPAPQKLKEVMMRSWKRGVTIVACGVSTIRIAPPLTIDRELLDKALDIISNAIIEVEKETT